MGSAVCHCYFGQLQTERKEGPLLHLVYFDLVSFSPCYSFFHFDCRAFETQMTRLEAEFVRREAPPSYGQLIAQGLIPPVEDFPVYNASQVNDTVFGRLSFQCNTRGIRI